MAKFHFVEDYEAHVRNLKKRYPIDEAISLAVGGGYETIGAVAADIVVGAGLKSGMSALDFGCGSGRVAHALSKRVELEGFLGIDVVQDLLTYAASKTPQHYRYVKNNSLTIPAKADSFDFAYAFSVFTHLLHEETYLYLLEMHRTLKTGGTLLFSFLEFAAAAHWTVFEVSLEARKAGGNLPLNTFTDRNQLAVMARHAKFEIVDFVDGAEARWSKEPLGQSICVMRKL